MRANRLRIKFRAYSQGYRSKDCRSYPTANWD